MPSVAKESASSVLRGLSAETVFDADDLRVEIVAPRRSKFDEVEAARREAVKTSRELTPTFSWLRFLIRVYSVFHPWLN